MTLAISRTFCSSRDTIAAVPPSRFSREISLPRPPTPRTEHTANDSFCGWVSPAHQKNMMWRITRTSTDRTPRTWLVPLAPGAVVPGGPAVATRRGLPVGEGHGPLVLDQAESLDICVEYEAETQPRILEADSRVPDPHQLAHATSVNFSSQ